jgi:hypothetical protein
MELPCTTFPRVHVAGVVMDDAVLANPVLWWGGGEARQPLALAWALAYCCWTLRTLRDIIQVVPITYNTCTCDRFSTSAISRELY